MSRLWLYALVFVGLLAAPMIVKPSSIENLVPATGAVNQVIIMTPHNEQIRFEFARAFTKWHADNYGSPAHVIWSTPGGMVEIRRALTSAWESRLRQGLPVGGDADLLFGGGSYEFDSLKKEVVVEVDGQRRASSILQPLLLGKELIEDCYGAPTQKILANTAAVGDVTGDQNAVVEIAGQKLYDAKGYWYGVALATFGIVWNQQVIERLGVPPPKLWVDLADPRLRGWLTVVNPSQSGSVLTAFESIVQRVGWRQGMAILRRIAANARTFAPSGPRGPIDVAAGDSAMAVSIDFYGRFQAQAIAETAAKYGEKSDQDRVQFVTPVGQSAVDPDPIAVLRNPPNPQTAERFVQFCLSVHAQRLWQLPVGAVGGPHRFQLRRMPVMPALYASEGKNFIDAVNPFTDASMPAYPDPNMRPFIPLLFRSMAMDCEVELRQAWNCIASHPAFPKSATGLVSADDVQDAQLKSWLQRFDAWPEVETPEGQRSLGGVENLRAINQGWLKGGWKNLGFWQPEQKPVELLRATFVPFFQGHYRWIIEQSQSAGWR